VTLNHGLGTSVLVGQRTGQAVRAALRYHRNERFDAATALRHPPAVSQASDGDDTADSTR